LSIQDFAYCRIVLCEHKKAQVFTVYEMFGIIYKMKQKYPSIDEMRALHKKYAPTPADFELIFTHSMIICEIVKQIIITKKLSLQYDLIIAGSLLHDIGTYKLLIDVKKFDTEKYITHSILGYNLLKQEGCAEEICRFAKNHTGVGITKEEIIEKNLPLPPKDYFAKTTEEKLVMYADKFHSKTPQFNSPQSVRDHIQKYGDEKIQKFNDLEKMFGIPELEQLAKKYNHPLV